MISILALAAQYFRSAFSDDKAEQAIYPIEKLIASGEITADAVHQLQQETLNPLIDNLLDRPENDPGRRRIYERLTVLNQRLRKDQLPTVRIDRLFRLPQEVFSAIFGQLGYSSEAAKCSRAIGPRQEDDATYIEYEKNLQAGLGEERFNELKRKCKLPENADVKTRVKAIDAALQAEVRKVNGGKDPEFPQKLNPLSIEEITLYNDLINHWHEVESGRSVIALAEAAYLAHHGTEMEFPEEISLEGERVAFAKKWLAENKDIVISITTLYLASKNLKVIPSEIGQFFSLEKLHLENNQIEELPPELGRLTALEHLNLTKNQIKVLPPEIGKLTALQKLYVNNNQIKVLPPEIGELTALTELSFFCNQIEVIPPQIGQLKDLNHLNLSRNQIKVIPSAIGELTRLSYLNLGKNQIKVIPPEIGQLTVLTTLHLVYNQVEELPPEINELKALKLVTVYNSKIHGQRVSSKAIDSKIEKRPGLQILTRPVVA